MVTRATHTWLETVFYASFAAATCFTAGARFAPTAFFTDVTVFLLCFAEVLFVASLATLLLFLSAAQRAFCAAAIRALPSALRGSLTLFAGAVASDFLLTDPLGRPRRLPLGFIVPLMAGAVTGASESRARACCSCVICLSMASNISCVFISPRDKNNRRADLGVDDCNGAWRTGFGKLLVQAKYRVNDPETKS